MTAVAVRLALGFLEAQIYGLRSRDFVCIQTTTPWLRGTEDQNVEFAAALILAALYA